LGAELYGEESWSGKPHKKKVIRPLGPRRGKRDWPEGRNGGDKPLGYLGTKRETKFIEVNRTKKSLLDTKGK